jgi:hypothetical protein
MPRMKLHLAIALALAGSPALAQTTAIPLAPAAEEGPLTGEPRVQHIVVEDKGSRIEETRVRGQVQRITVTPKVGSKLSYEIVPTDGAGDSKGSAGKRVWNVLQF